MPDQPVGRYVVVPCECGRSVKIRNPWAERIFDAERRAERAEDERDRLKASGQRTEIHYYGDDA